MPLARHGLPTACLFALLLLTACGRGNAPAREASGTVPDDSVAAESTTAADVEAAAVDTEIPVIILEPSEVFPQANTPVPAMTASPADSAGALSPLEAAQNTDCAIESDLDLAGYPDLEDRLGCAQAPATFDPIGINEFGEGPDFDRFMLWFGSEDTIYVLQPDGTWRDEVDTWDESQPEFACNPYGGEAKSPPLPRRGFGKLWCSDPALQAVMGPVPREERLCQHAVLQRFADGHMLACFEDATVRYFQLRSDQTWSLDLQR